MTITTNLFNNNNIGKFFNLLTPGWFRFILAFIVVFFHSVSFFPLGHYAVYVFFILSGYWIFKMYNEKYSRYKNEYWIYIQSRFYRLMPLYWIILIFTFFVYFITNSIINVSSSTLITTSLSNLFIFGGSNSFLLVIPAWSLDIEVQFYLIAPLLIYLSKYITPVLLLLVSIVISFLLLSNYVAKYGVVNNVFFYLPFFLIGGVIYLENIIIDKKVALASTGLIILILIINYVKGDLRTEYFLNLNAKIFSFSYSEIVNVVLTILTIPLLSINVRQKTLHKNENLLSSMSYVIYLLHWPLLLIYGKLVAGLSTLNKLLPLLLFYAISVGLSYIISLTLDNFFEKKRKFWFKNRKLYAEAITEP